MIVSFYHIIISLVVLELAMQVAVNISFEQIPVLPCAVEGTFPILAVHTATNAISLVH